MIGALASFICTFRRVPVERNARDYDCRIGFLGLFTRNAIGNFRYRHLSRIVFLLAESPLTILSDI